VRIAVTADLHYGKNPNEDAATESLADRIIQRDPDVIVIAGDVAIANPLSTVACLRLFAKATARKYVIPGNHDLWSRGGETSADSYTIWERLFTRSSELGGFLRFDHAPAMLEPVGGVSIGLVGSIGWYDYSFTEGHGIPKRWLERKLMPGEDGRPRAIWNDGRFIKWEHDDESFTRMLVDRLRNDVQTVRDESTSIVAVTHHLPFTELLPPRDDKDSPPGGVDRFTDAFLGSRAIGEVLLAEPKVTLAVSGHSHSPCEASIRHVRAITVGSSGAEKRALFFEADAAGNVVQVGGEAVPV